MMDTDSIKIFENYKIIGEGITVDKLRSTNIIGSVVTVKMGTVNAEFTIEGIEVDASDNVSMKGRAIATYPSITDASSQVITKGEVYDVVNDLDTADSLVHINQTPAMLAATGTWMDDSSIKPSTIRDTGQVKSKPDRSDREKPGLLRRLGKGAVGTALNVAAAPFKNPDVGSDPISQLPGKAIDALTRWGNKPAKGAKKVNKPGTRPEDFIIY